MRVFSQDSQVRQSTTYSLHQPQGNKEHGTERSGYLYKKSDGWVFKITVGLCLEFVLKTFKKIYSRNMYNFSETKVTSSNSFFNWET